MTKNWPVSCENKVSILFQKRIIVKNIEGLKAHKQFSDYAEEFEYLTNSGIALAVQAISNPAFPLAESESKNLLKLYLSDVGLLTGLLYGTNINAMLMVTHFIIMTTSKKARWMMRLNL